MCEFHGEKWRKCHHVYTCILPDAAPRLQLTGERTFSGHKSLSTHDRVNNLDIKRGKQVKDDDMGKGVNEEG